MSHAIPEAQLQHIRKDVRHLPEVEEAHAIVRAQLEDIAAEGFDRRYWDRDAPTLPMSLLDCCTGMGEFLEGLEGDERFRTYGIDIDPDCVAAAKMHAPQARLWTMDAADLTQGWTGYFHVVVATWLIEHVENPTKFLREIHRVSKGWALISTPNAMRPLKVWMGLRGRLKRERSGHIGCWDHHMFVQLLENHGFEVVRIDVRFVDFPWGRKWFPRFTRWLSYGPLKRWFPMLGSEMYAMCRKK